jgi:membrane AbrB-like protein
MNRPVSVSDSAALRETGFALGFAAIGATVATWLAAPAPLITGPAVVATIAGISGLRSRIPEPLRNLIFVIIGVVIGSGVDPGVIKAAGQWPVSLALLALASAAIMAAGGWLLRRVFGLERKMAILAATPGHLSFVLATTAETGGDVAQVSVIQSIRLLCLTLLVPLATTAAGYTVPSSGISNHVMTVVPLAAILALSGAVGLGFQRLRVPAALLIGGMAVSTVAHLSGWVEGTPPAWLAMPALAMMGALIGSRFSGVTLPQLRRDAAAGIAVTLLSVLISAAAVVLALYATDLSVATLALSMAPGGLETMAALALLTGAEPTVVAAHHVFRLFVLTFFVPVALGWKR